MNRPEITHKIKQTLTGMLQDIRIIVYGSEARGDAHKDSDIDILILVDKEQLSYQEKGIIMDLLYDIELTTGVLISPIIYTRKQWENRPFKTPFYVNVMREGVML